jgi:hypothetical protein
MQISHRARVGLIALVAMVGASISSAASADSGIVRISVVKGGWFIGANGGCAVGIGARLIQLANDKGAVLKLEGRQIGLIANLDLSGLAIALR